MKTLFVLFLLAGFGVKADAIAIHGMVLFGEKRTYASHLPMFHAPHDHQVVMEVDISGSPNSTLEAKLKATLKGQKLFTLVPKAFDLTKLLDGSLTNFPAKLYQGHFEKGGHYLGELSVSVKNLINSSKLDPSADVSSVYVAFGKGGEYFAFHVVGGKPSFDTILKIKQPYTMEFGHCRTRVCDEFKKIPILDSELPLQMTKFFSQSVEVGHAIGSPATGITEVTEVIYFDDVDLAH